MLSNIDFLALPPWVIFILICVFIIAFSVFLYLGISGNKDIKFFFGLFEIRNSGLKPTSKKRFKEFNKFNGYWDVKGEDIEIPNHPFLAMYIYEATFQVAINKLEIKLTGNLTYRNMVSNDKIFETRIEGLGYLTDGQSSICYETFSELYKRRHTTGLGVLYLKFNPSGRVAEGYFLSSNETTFGVGVGTVRMNKKV